MPLPPGIPERVGPIRCPGCGNTTGEVHHTPTHPPGDDLTVTLTCAGCGAAFEMLATSYCTGLRVGVLLEPMRRADRAVLDEGQRCRVQEARDILGTWDLARGPEPYMDRERVLADHLRAVLAVIDQVAAPAGEAGR